jgi:hypothetical protein
MQWFFAANAQAGLRGLTLSRTAAVSSSLWLGVECHDIVDKKMSHDIVDNAL